MEKKPEIAVIGYVAQDINITPSERTTLPGGAAYFSAIAASRITEPVGLVTRIGSDFPADFLLSRVLKKGVITIDGGTTPVSTQIYLSDTDHTQRDIVFNPGVGESLKGEDIPEEWLTFLKLIHVATMIPSQQHAVIEFIRTHAPQARISIDTDSSFLNDEEHAKTLKKSFEASNIAFANRKEYELMGDTIEALPAAVVKLDKDGALYMEKGKVKARTKTRQVEAVDVTGAGDIFAGTFLACLMEEFSLQESLNKAAEVATESVTQKGVNHLFE